VDIVEAVRKRKSIRAFKPDPMPRSILKEIMEEALWAPSWANTQPWEFAIVSGPELEAIRQGFLEKAGEESIPDIARPQEFPEPYNSRRGGLARMELEKLGIKREDKQGRGWWRLRNLNLYGAPSAIYIFVDRSFFLQGQGINVWPVFDCGLVAENIMLLATARGLGTVTQAMAVAYPQVVKKVLGIPEAKLMVVGIAIGYPDWDEAITQIRSEREPLEKVARWYGFD
jgi:nitroreductase